MVHMIEIIRQGKVDFPQMIVSEITNFLFCFTFCILSRSPQYQ